MNTHVLKTDSNFFLAIGDGKNFEVRKNDRNFEVGDRLVLQEVKGPTKVLTGDEITARVSYILRDFPAVKDGFVVMGLADISPSSGRVTPPKTQEVKSSDSRIIDWCNTFPPDRITGLGVEQLPDFVIEAMGDVGSVLIAFVLPWNTPSVAWEMIFSQGTFHINVLVRESLEYDVDHEDPSIHVVLE